MHRDTVYTPHYIIKLVSQKFMFIFVQRLSNNALNIKHTTRKLTNENDRADIVC